MLEPDNKRAVMIGDPVFAEPSYLLAYIRHDETARADGFDERRWYRMGTQDESEPPATFAGLLDYARQNRTQIALLAVADVETP
jgi:hypothetical protein